MIDANHSQLDNVGRRPLDRRIHSYALRIATHDGVVRVDVGQILTPPKSRFDIAAPARFFDAAIHIFLHFRVGGEVIIYEFARLRPTYVHPLCESERRDSVNDAEVRGFRLPALVAAHFRQIFLENACGRGGVNVLPLLESLD